MAVDPELIDKLLADYKTPEDIIGENGLLKQLTKELDDYRLKAGRILLRRPRPMESIRRFYQLLRKPLYSA